jgi:hypothetical protein
MRRPPPWRQPSSGAANHASQAAGAVAQRSTCGPPKRHSPPAARRPFLEQSAVRRLSVTLDRLLILRMLQPEGEWERWLGKSGQGC